MKIANKILDIIKILFNSIGIDIKWRKRNPSWNLLGLRNYKIDTIIDIGANTGQFAKEILKIYPYAKLYSFEPLPKPYQALSEWAINQETYKIHTFNIALGPIKQKVVMNLHLDHSPSSSILTSTKLNGDLYPQTIKQNLIEVQQDTLDNIMKDIKLNGNILIKMDVQGYENMVISGGKEVFSKAIACITEISIDNLYENQAEFSKLIQEFDLLGYDYSGNINQICKPDGSCIYLDAHYRKNKTKKTNEKQDQS
jgi:FkbM family methyltransferase